MWLGDALVPPSLHASFARSGLLGGGRLVIEDEFCHLACVEEGLVRQGERGVRVVPGGNLTPDPHEVFVSGCLRLQASTRTNVSPVVHPVRANEASRESENRAWFRLRLEGALGCWRQQEPRSSTERERWFVGKARLSLASKSTVPE